MNRLDDPRFHVRLNLALLVFWTVLLVPSLLWWRDSIIWVVVMSHYALIAAHLSALMAAKAEQKVDESEVTA